jgi:hypothetical protein
MEKQDIYFVLGIVVIFVFLFWFMKEKIKPFFRKVHKNFVNFLAFKFNPKNQKKNGFFTVLVGFLLLVNPFFHWFNLNADKRLAEAKKDLQALRRKKKKWPKQIDAVSKENLRQIKLAITVMREELYEIERKQAKSDEPKSFVKRIGKIVREINRKEKELYNWKIKFKEEYVSSIKIAEYEAVVKDYEDQKKAVCYLSVAWSGLFTALVLFFAVPFVLATWFLRGWIMFSLDLVIFLAFITTIIFILVKAYETVPEKREWIIEFFGEYLLTWTPGWHFAFPFFMERKAQVYKGAWKISLYMDNETRDGKKSARVDFTNTAAEVNVELFFRIFSSYKSVYEIHDVVDAISEKMEAGIRAYFGNKRVDEAIQERADIELRQIIIQNATEADVFQDWGVVITSLAVTDIILTDVDEKVRAAKLKAEKDLEIAEVEEKTAEVKRRIAVINGRAEGEHLIQLSTAADISPESAKDYKLQLEKYDAYKKSGVLIAGDSDGSAKTGATIGAAAQVSAQAVNSSKNSGSKEGGEE